MFHVKHPKVRVRPRAGDVSRETLFFAINQKTFVSHHKAQQGFLTEEGI